MAELQNTPKICEKGHQYYKTSDCPSCPVCENEQKPKNGFLAKLSAPARRALENNDIQTLQKLASYTETEILDLHGMGKASLPMLNTLLAAEGLTFK